MSSNKNCEYKMKSSQIENYVNPDDQNSNPVNITINQQSQNQLNNSNPESSENILDVQACSANISSKNTVFLSNIINNSNQSALNNINQQSSNIKIYENKNKSVGLNGKTKEWDIDNKKKKIL